MQPIDTQNKNKTYYADAIKQSAEMSMTDFLKWFNGGTNITEIVNSGFVNFYTHILRPAVYEKTKAHSQDLTALEIGCGGGRILNAAGKYFGTVVGTDIHDNLAQTKQFLESQGTQADLLQTKNNHIPVEDKSVDFVYSFIVFQHILKIEIFETYLNEIKRILKPNGQAVIYFGRPRFFSKRTFGMPVLNKITKLADRILYEGLYLNLFTGGYFEDKFAKVNHVNLTVTIRKARQKFKQAGLKIIETGHSGDKKRSGTQYYFIAEHF